MKGVLLVGLVLLCGASAARAGTIKVVELKDGSAVVGEVLDEGDTGYLIKKRDGTTVRVNYGDIAAVSVLAGGEGQSPSRMGEDLIVDAFSFPDHKAAHEYSRRRLLLDVLDVRSGTWTSASSSRTTGGIQHWDLGQPLSAVLSGATGTPVEVGLQVNTGAERTATVTSTNFDETIERMYRIVTGEGVEVTRLSRIELPRPTLVIPRGGSTWSAILEFEEARTDRTEWAFSALERCNSIAESHSIDPQECYEYSAYYASKFQDPVAAHSEPLFTYMGIPRPDDVTIDLYMSDRKRSRRERQGKPNEFALPRLLTVAELLPYMAEYNQRLAASLGGV